MVQPAISDDDDSYDAAGTRDDHSTGMAGDIFVRNDKYRTADPSSCKSRSGNGYASTNDENHNFDAASTDNRDRA